MICGGGLAGLSLALQLRKELPSLSLAIIEPNERPLPKATFKVGEAVTEAGAFYLDQLMGRPYFEANHLYKMGFRFFFGGSNADLASRPEFGLVRFPSVHSYNLDRGRLEEDMRAEVVRRGVTLLEGCKMLDVGLAEPQELHRVHYQRLSSGESGTLQARWFVDASGRRRFLQRKLGLQKAVAGKCNAAWFRLPGRIDITNLVPATDIAWHSRVEDDQRYYSVNHLVGKGYWIWVIPLSGDVTSIGLITLKDDHDFSQFTSHERALPWIREVEPEFASLIEDTEPLDYRCLRDYSYSATQAFSENRWACIGEAAAFTDPLYAAGTDILAYGNNLVTEMIRADSQGTLQPTDVRFYNRTFLALNESILPSIQTAYRVFQSPVVAALKVLWDTAAGWAFLAPQVYNADITHADAPEEARLARSRYFFLTRRMQDFFVEWAAHPDRRLTFDFINFLDAPSLIDIRQRSLKDNKSAGELIDDFLYCMDRVEELALAMFLVAVEDTQPEKLEALKGKGWLNAWAISLDAERWENDGLWSPRTEARDIGGTHDQLRAFFRELVPAR